MKKKFSFVLVIAITILASFFLFGCDKENAETVKEEVIYHFAEDGSKCVAMRIDVDNYKINNTATATMSSAVTTQPSYEQKGVTTYTATFDVDWASTQTKVLANIPSLDGTISFNVNGVELDKTLIHKSDEPITYDKVAEFIKENTNDADSALSLFMDKHFGEPFEDIELAAKDMQELKVYVCQGYRLTFDSEGAGKVDNIFIKSPDQNKTFGEILPVVTKDEWLFEGWKDSEDNLIDLNASFDKKSQHLTASWGLKYSTSDDGVTISAYEGVSPELVIPASINDKKVIAIKDFGMYGNDFVQSISFEQGTSIKSIGSNAFSYCDNLVSVIFPNTLEYIGQSLFLSSEKMQTLKIDQGNSLYTSIADGVEFNGIIYIGSADIPSREAHDQYGAYDFNTPVITQNDLFCGISTTTIPKMADAISGFAFCGSSFENLVIPANIKLIGDNAFKYADFTSIALPEGLTTIKNSAFYGCDKLKSITIPSSVTTIGDFAFGFSGLESVSIPKGVTKIGLRAFWYCEHLKSLTFEDGSSLTHLGDYSFERCVSLSSVVIPASVSYVGVASFANCTSLQSIKVDEGNTLYTSKDDGQEFNGVIYIGDDPIPAHDALQNDRIPEITKNDFIIGSKNAYIPSSVDCIMNYAFMNIPITHVTIPSNVSLICEAAFLGSHVEEVVFAPSHFPLTIENYAFKNCKKLETLTLPSRLTGSIGSSTFQWDESLKLLSLADTDITSIGDVVFYGCENLQTLILPNTLTSIDDSALNGLTTDNIFFNVLPDPELVQAKAFSGKNIYVYLNPEDPIPNPPYPSYIDGYWKNSPIIVEDNLDRFNYKFVFDENTQGYKLASYQGSKNSIVVPDSYNGKPVTAIGDSALAKDFITSITLPNTIKIIGSHAFEGSAIRRIQIPASVEKIGMGIVKNCHHLYSIKIDPQNKFFTSDLAKEYDNCYIIYIGDQPVTMGDFSYSQFDLLASVDGEYLPDGIVTILKESMWTNDIHEIGFPSSVTTIQEGAVNSPELDSIYLPSSVTSIGARAISSDIPCMIITDAPADLEGWQKGWASDSCFVYYGYDEETIHTYILQTNGGTISDPDFNNNTIKIAGLVYLPKPKTTDKVKPCFEGWYTSPNFEPNTKVCVDYYSPNPSTTLYAKWMSEEEFYNGSSFDRPILIPSNNSYILLQKANVPTYYKFSIGAYAGYDIKFITGQKNINFDIDLINRYGNVKQSFSNVNSKDTTLVILNEDDYYLKITCATDITRIDNLGISITERKN